MPYIEEGLRKELLTEPERAANNVGAMNYLFTVAILKIWNNDPKYSTIHALKTATKSRAIFAEIDEIVFMLAENGGAATDIECALELAFMEFYRRIGAQYEFHKLNMNGDLEGYTAALLHLNQLAREDFNSRIKYVPSENK